MHSGARLALRNASTLTDIYPFLYGLSLFFFWWSCLILLCRQSANKNQSSTSVKSSSLSLLEKTCDLINFFPEYLDVVVSVARKTDGRHWADLFSAAGRSTE